jgi:hypothetical protein
MYVCVAISNESPTHSWVCCIVVLCTLCYFVRCVLYQVLVATGREHIECSVMHDKYINEYVSTPAFNIPKSNRSSRTLLLHSLKKCKTNYIG